ncbi:TSHZ3 (predicted) [Pycnogonum litorale]
MPRRKQDRPKRMKWEEGDRGERPTSSLDGDVVSAQSASGSEADEDTDSESKRRKVDGDMSDRGESPSRCDDLAEDRRPTLDSSSYSDSDHREEVKMNSHESPVADSPEASIPLDFSVRKYDVLDLTSKCEINNEGEESSCPLDLSVPRMKRSNADNNDGHKKFNKVDLVQKSPWGYPLSHGKPTPIRPNSYWDGTNGKPQNQENVSRRSGSDTNSYLQSRPSVWQNQWLTKGGEEINKDVLKCVWCKESFHTLSDLTVHMKRSPRCGVNLPRTASPVTSSPSSNYNSHHHHHHHQQQQQQQQQQHSHHNHQNNNNNNGSSSKSSSSGSVGSNSLNDLNMLIKETMPLPRKLVRGQDVWLGKGAEQTKQILKCMWCGQSFRTLADMTTHMRQTQHYTNIISQEQLISWKSPEEKSGENSVAGATNPAVNAVLTCKVCDQAFSSLKELSSHMSKNSHYQEHLFKAISEGGSRRRPVREKRKKALPVRKLLELERSNHKKGGDGESNSTSSKHHGVSVPESLAGGGGGSGRIICEKCGHRIETTSFVEHIRTCVGKSADKVKTFEDSGSDRSEAQSPSSNSIKVERDASDKKQSDEDGNGNKSVLNAIEMLIEKSFDSAVSKPNVTSAFILKKMGFDENAFAPRSKSPNGPKNHSLRSSVSPHDNSISSRPSSRDSFPSSPSDDKEHVKPTAKRRQRRLPSNSEKCNDNCSKSKSNHADTRQREKKVANKETESKERLNVVIDDCENDDDGRVKQLPLSPPQLFPSSPSDSKQRDRIVAKSLNNVFKTKDNKVCNDKNDQSCDEREDGTSETGSVLSDANVDNPCDNPSDGALSADDEHFISDLDDRPAPNFDKANKVKTESGNRRKRLVKTMRDRHHHHHQRRHRRHHNGNDYSLIKKATPSPKLDMSPPSATSSSSLLTGGAKRSGGGSDHPLMQLQKLLDKTDAQLFSKRGYNNKLMPNFGGSSPATSQGPSANNHHHHQHPSSPFVSFGWAYNDALTYDTISKTSFNDVNYGSFTPPPVGSTTSSNDRKSESPEKSIPAKYGQVNNNNSISNHNVDENKLKSTVEESPHSKFLKYSELAKQLSSK